MQSYLISATENPNEIQFVFDKLKEENNNHPNYPEITQTYISLICKNAAGIIIGGILTYTYFDALHIEVLWVDAKYRKAGIGSALLQEIESQAKKANCAFMHTDTFTFQAPEFYLKSGFSVFAELSGYKNKTTRYYLKKILL